MLGRSFGITLTLIIDLKVAELISVLVVSDNSEILTHLLLLQVLLSKVLEVALAEVNLCLNNDTILVLANSDGITKVASLAANLDLLGEEVREIVKDDNIILNGERAVDSVLVHSLLALGALLAFLCFFDH